MTLMKNSGTSKIRLLLKLIPIIQIKPGEIQGKTAPEVEQSVERTALEVAIWSRRAANGEHKGIFSQLSNLQLRILKR
jgi:hypothetical protein